MEVASSNTLAGLKVVDPDIELRAIENIGTSVLVTEDNTAGDDEVEPIGDNMAVEGVLDCEINVLLLPAIMTRSIRDSAILDRLIISELLEAVRVEDVNRDENVPETIGVSMLSIGPDTEADIGALVILGRGKTIVSELALELDTGGVDDVLLGIRLFEVKFDALEGVSELSVKVAMEIDEFEIKALLLLLLKENLEPQFVMGL